MGHFEELNMRIRSIQAESHSRQFHPNYPIIGFTNFFMAHGVRPSNGDVADWRTNSVTFTLPGITRHVNFVHFTADTMAAGVTFPSETSIGAQSFALAISGRLHTTGNVLKISIGSGISPFGRVSLELSTTGGEARIIDDDSAQLATPAFTPGVAGTDYILALKAGKLVNGWLLTGAVLDSSGNVQQEQVVEGQLSSDFFSLGNNIVLRGTNINFTLMPIIYSGTLPPTLYADLAYIRKSMVEMRPGLPPAWLHRSVPF